MPPTSATNCLTFNRESTETESEDFAEVVFAALAGRPTARTDLTLLADFLVEPAGRPGRPVFDFFFDVERMVLTKPGLTATPFLPSSSEICFGFIEGFSLLKSRIDWDLLGSPAFFFAMMFDLSAEAVRPE